MMGCSQTNLALVVMLCLQPENMILHFWSNIAAFMKIVHVNKQMCCYVHVPVSLKPLSDKIIQNFQNGHNF